MTALRVCPVPGCPILTHGGPCEAHRLARARARDRARPSRHERGYGQRWRQVRGRFLKAHPTCERCGRPATEAHHRDGLGPLGPMGYTWANLQALCKSCHSRIPS
jgi:5-methylcytosine-specific restriction protein A